MIEMLRERTEQRLRFARLHLDELAGVPSGSGDDFERAHLEAILSQLLGAYDALLSELNVALGCNRDPTDVSLGKLRQALQARGRTSAVLRKIYELQDDEASWLRHLQDLRHAATHRRGVPLAFHLGGPLHRKVSFKHPDTREEFPQHSGDTLASWLGAMRGLVDESRQQAHSEMAG